ncbi:MAG: DUF72 domain-containing protein [Methylobacterium mesophilicum]|nr:DUF72 domain-containing protein [Methylobacterium mesophilicum]
MSEAGRRALTRIGVAGWALPAVAKSCFPAAGTHLERYAARLGAVEINSSFYRHHQQKTYARWAESAPDDFRFAVKLPKAITHERRLVDCGELVARFAEETAGLGAKRGPVLAQLPPSLRFPGAEAIRFLEELGERLGSPVVVEPRHASWFTQEVDARLAAIRVARVAADPAKVPEAREPGGWPGLAYFRLHGSPEIYRSPYGAETLGRQAEAVTALAAKGVESWTVFDNTTFGAATLDALELRERVT